MRAVKLNAQVTQDHTLNLKLPEDVREGPAEVIVLVPDPEVYASQEPNAGTLGEFLSKPRVDRSFIRSKAEIDDSLRAERDSWE